MKQSRVKNYKLDITHIII